MWYKRFKFFVYFIAAHALLIACILYTDQTHPFDHHNSLGIFVIVYGFLALITSGLALSLSRKEIYNTTYWPFVLPTLISGIVLSLQSTEPSLLLNISWAVFAIWSAFFSATFGSLLFSLILNFIGSRLFSLILNFSQHRTSLGHENLTQKSDPKTSKNLFNPHWYVRLPHDDE
jgi:hypothetical protein